MMQFKKQMLRETAVRGKGYSQTYYVKLYSAYYVLAGCSHEAYLPTSMWPCCCICLGSPEHRTRTRTQRWRQPAFSIHSSAIIMLPWNIYENDGRAEAGPVPRKERREIEKAERRGEGGSGEHVGHKHGPGSFALWCGIILFNAKLHHITSLSSSVSSYYAQLDVWCQGSCALSMEDYI